MKLALCGIVNRNNNTTHDLRNVLRGRKQLRLDCTSLRQDDDLQAQLETIRRVHAELGNFLLTKFGTVVRT